MNSISMNEIEKITGKTKQSIKNIEGYLTALLLAIDEVLESESNDGCSDDLTVVSMSAIKKLRKLRKK